MPIACWITKSTQRTYITPLFHGKIYANASQFYFVRTLEERSSHLLHGDSLSPALQVQCLLCYSTDIQLPTRPEPFHHPVKY